MLHDLVEALPGIKVSGIDISEYAISNCIETIGLFYKWQMQTIAVSR